MSSRKLSRSAVLIIAIAVAAAAGLSSLTLYLNARDSHRLLQLQADDASVSVTTLLSQIKTTMTSVGSVAAATSADPASLSRVVAQDPAMVTFSSVAVLGGTGQPTTVVKGTPAPSALPRARVGRGFEILGFVGRGRNRVLSLAMGSPVIPGGYTVYAEVPLPDGTIVPSPFPQLSIAVYNGARDSAPVVFASTRHLPLRGDRVGVLIDLNRAAVTTPDKASGPVLLFMVASRGSLLPTAEQLLPWILAAIALLTGGLAVWAVQSAARRRDLAIAAAQHLAQKNAELDRAMARSLEAEQARQQLEAELQQVQRLEAVGQLAGGIAHDFNNLLMVIQTHADFLDDEIPDEGTARSDLTEIRHAATRAADLTRRLLVFSRRDLVRPSVLDVNETVTDVVRLLRRSVGEDVTLSLALSESLPPVLCDPGELHQVLVNLVVNARQAIEGSGSIVVTTAAADIDPAVSPVPPDVQAGPAVRISVTDDGCGMTPEVMARVFEPYFTTKEAGSGTGLGLATVYGIVRRYGGYTTVDSAPGAGTTLHIHLPATAAEPEAVPERAVTPADEEPPAPAGAPTVLLVEDEDGVRRACQRILEGGGYRVLSAATAAEALEGYRPEQFDVLLTDVVMPGGLSGRDLVERMQELRPGLPVLFMSGYSQDQIATRGVLEDGIEVIEKPFAPEDLLSAIGAVLAAAAAPAPAR